MILRTTYCGIEKNSDKFSALAPMLGLPAAQTDVVGPVTTSEGRIRARW